MAQVARKQAIGYLRVSTAAQAAEGVSLDAQKARIEAWAASQGLELAEVYCDEGISGKRADNRPALQKAIRDACTAKAPLVTYSLSRLARSTRDAIDIAERLRRSGADLVSLSESIDTTSASGKMLFRMLAVLAEFERDLVSERTTAALAHKRSRGERISRICRYGYEFTEGGRLQPVPSEQATLARIRALRASGASWQGVADALNAEGVRNRAGSQWRWEGVRKIARGVAA